MVCAAALMLIGCTAEAPVEGGVAAKGAKISLNARIVNGELVRTGLDEDWGDGYRQLYFEVGDQIALIDNNNVAQPLTVDEEYAGAEMGGWHMFSGEANANLATKSYPVVYPHAWVKSGNNESVTINLPKVQTRNDGGGVLLYGHTLLDAANTEDYATLDFYNLMGILEFQVVGEGTVSKITVKSASQKLSGAATITPDYAGPATLAVTGSNVVELLLAEPVVLSASDATSFFVAIPAGTYPAGDLSIAMSLDNGHAALTSKSEHVLEASHIKPLTLTASSSVEYIDLTAGDKFANAFVLPEAGWYKFAAKTRGGLTTIKNPKTGADALTIGGEGAQACNAWESHDGMVSNVIYVAADNTIRFYYNGQEGNSMICMVANGLSQWNWHIWGVNDLKDQVIGENTYMDRNLGAWGAPANVEETHAYLAREYNVGNGEAYSSMGLMWQWGRPNPFPCLGRYHLRAGTLNWYQRETDGAVTFADLYVENGATNVGKPGEQEAKLGFTPTYYFPSPEIMGALYADKTGTADSYINLDGGVTYTHWYNKWNMTNNTNGVTMAVALANPMRAYGTGAGVSAPTCNQKYWCNDLFTGSFDFDSDYAVWNYGGAAKADKVFDVCPYGYHIPDGAQAVKDYSTLTFTWRTRYNNGTTSADGPGTSTTRTTAAYATATDGSFVWIPCSGARLHYGGAADCHNINWWCAANNNKDVVLQWNYVKDDAGALTSTPSVAQGFYDKDGENNGATEETVASLMLAIRCVKDK